MYYVVYVQKAKNHKILYLCSFVTS